MSVQVQNSYLDETLYDFLKKKRKEKKDEVLWGNMIDCHLTFAHIERP